MFRSELMFIHTKDVWFMNTGAIFYTVSTQTNNLAVKKNLSIWQLVVLNISYNWAIK